MRQIITNTAIIATATLLGACQITTSNIAQNKNGAFDIQTDSEITVAEDDGTIIANIDFTDSSAATSGANTNRRPDDTNTDAAFSSSERELVSRNTRGTDVDDKDSQSDVSHRRYMGELDKDAASVLSDREVISRGAKQAADVYDKDAASNAEHNLAETITRQTISKSGNLDKDAAPLPKNAAEQASRRTTNAVGKLDKDPDPVAAEHASWQATNNVGGLDKDAVLDKDAAPASATHASWQATNNGGGLDKDAAPRLDKLAEHASRQATNNRGDLDKDHTPEPDKDGPANSNNDKDAVLDKDAAPATATQASWQATNNGGGLDKDA